MGFSRQKEKVKNAIGGNRIGRMMLFLYKRIHVFLRDELAPDLQSERWARSEDEWVDAVPPEAESATTSSSAENRLDAETEEMFLFMTAVQEELKGNR